MRKGAACTTRPTLVSKWPNPVVVHGIESSRQWMCRRSKTCYGDRLGSGRHWVRPGYCRGAALHRPPAGRFVATGAKLRGDPALTRHERPSG